jgi:ABC-2 type transport system ATP-binding protein
VLLLDEPTTGVDPVTRQDFWQLIIRLTSPARSPSPSPSPPGSPTGVLREGARGEGGVSVVISTPYMDEASRCHRVAFMQRGRIIAEGVPSALRAVLNDRILELRGSPLNAMRRLARRDPDVEDVRAFGDRLHLRVRENTAGSVMERLPGELAQAGKVTDLRKITPSLEDVFISLLEESGEAEARPIPEGPGEP